ncbi:MAG: hypothetical protein ACT443_01595, partial [Gemmatimonadota bacterium]
MDPELTLAVGQFVATLLGTDSPLLRELAVDIKSNHPDRRASDPATYFSVPPLHALARALAVGRALPVPIRSALEHLITAEPPPLTIKRLCRDLDIERTTLWRAQADTLMRMTDVIRWIHVIRAAYGITPDV